VYFQIIILVTCIIDNVDVVSHVNKECNPIIGKGRERSFSEI